MRRISYRRAPRKGIGMAKLRREETGDFRRSLLAESISGCRGASGTPASILRNVRILRLEQHSGPVRFLGLGERRIWRRLLRQSHRPLIAVCYPNDILMRD